MEFWNARVIDGTGRGPFERAWVRVQDGRIAEVESTVGSRDPIPEGAIDLDGRTLMPGLIDAHATKEKSGWSVQDRRARVVR